MNKLEKYREEILKNKTEIIKDIKKDKIDDNQDIITNEYLKFLGKTWKE